MARISVILPTYRPGGVELAEWNLRAQTFDDFEVVIADEHVGRRELWLRALVGDRSVRFADMSRSKFPRASAPIAHNEAIRVCDSELVVFLSDYAFAEPDWLETHWKIWEGSNKTRCAMGPFEFVVPDAEWLKTPPPIRCAIDDDNAYSIFKPGFIHEIDDLPPQQGLITKQGASSSQDPKLTLTEGPIGHQYYYNKNESVPLDKLVEINGADEDFVGLHPYDDAALALRLHSVGVRWWLAHRAKIKIVQIRQWMDLTKWDRPVTSAEAQFRRVEARVARGIIRTENGLVKP